MKKLSLVLALVLVLTCGVLAACGGNEDASSVAESSTAAESKAESSATTESSEAVSEDASSEAVSEDASSEAVSEDASSEVDVSAPEADDANLASGKSYTTSPLFGQNSSWQYDPEAAPAYPDENGNSLVDGIFAPDTAAYSDAVWAGFNSNFPGYESTGYHWITIDLGESKDLAKFVFGYGTKALANGIAAPASLDVLVSDDGETWTSVDDIVPEDNEASANGVAVIEGAAKGQYVQFRFTSGGWAFVSEIEVYAAAE